MSFWETAIPTIGGAAGGFMMGGPVGAVAGGLAGYSGAQAVQSQNAENRASAQKQMDFQHKESSTAHQREVADLKAAGLNPALSADGGPGSQSGSGSSYNAQAMPSISFPDVLQAKSISQTDQRIRNETLSTAASVAKDSSQTDINKMEKILKQKGMIRANLEGSASGLFDSMLKDFKDSYMHRNPPMDPKQRRKFNENTLKEYNEKNGLALTYDKMFPKFTQP